MELMNLMNLMKRNRKNKKRSFGKVMVGVLIGSVVGATLGWLTAPTSGREMRNTLGEKLGEGRRSIREKIKTSEENVESRARDLMAEVNENSDAVKKRVARQGKEPLPID